MNLATCTIYWQSRKHPLAAISQPHHIKGMGLATEKYKVYALERYVPRKIQPLRGAKLGG